MRIGQGYDVHRLTPGRRLVLGGVEIPWELGLDGHSDADVLVHAVMDALLGAAALGDIGKLFPDTDDRYLGCDSIVLLREVGRLVRSRGYRISNIDSTIVAQRPKAEALKLPPDRVSVKATTEERLGFTGSGEGMAAQAVCLLEEEL